MANHKSSLKRIRQTKTKTLHNKYYAKTMRNAVRKLRAMTDKEEAVKLYPVVQAMLDKLTKTNIIHRNKAANLKPRLALHISKLGQLAKQYILPQRDHYHKEWYLWLYASRAESGTLSSATEQNQIAYNALICNRADRHHQFRTQIVNQQSHPPQRQ